MSLGLSFGASVWTTALSLCTIPVMMAGLGLGGYGTYSLAFSVAALGSYLDFGLGWSTTKFVASAESEGKRHVVGTVLLASLAFNAAVGLLFALGLIGLSRWISVRALHVDPCQVEETSSLLKLAALSFLGSTLASGLISGLRGMRQFALATVIATGSTTVSVLGAAVAAGLGWGILWAAGFQLLGVVLGVVVSLICCQRSLLAAEGWGALRAQLRAMLGFSIWTYIGRIVQMTFGQFDKILIARWAGPAALPFYTVPFNFAQRINFLAGPAVTAIFPLASGSAGDRTAFVRQYLGASRLVHVVTGAVALGILAFGDHFLNAWIGPEMALHGTFYLRLLTIGFWIMSVWSIDAGCIEGWTTARTTCAITVTGLVIGVVAGLIASTACESSKAVAIGVTAYFCSCGLGSAIVWQRISRYSLGFIVRYLLLPVVEMSVLAAVAGRFGWPSVVGRTAAFAALAVLIALLAAYGIVRAFTRQELAAMLARASGFIRRPSA